MSEATEAKQELIDEGFEASFGDYAKDSEGFDTDVFVEVAKFFILEGDWQKDFSDDVRASDVFVFAPYDINLDTMPIIVFDSKEHRIIKPKRFKEKRGYFSLRVTNKSMTPEELTEKLLKQLDYIVQQPIAVINSRIVSNTRKFSGQARINTRIGINKPDTQVKLATTYTKDFFTNTVANKRLEFQRMVKDIKLGDVVFTTNSVKYFKYLEDKDLMFFRGVKRYKHEVAKAFRETK